MKYEYALEYAELMSNCALSENTLKELMEKNSIGTVIGAFCNNTLIWRKLRNDKIKQQALAKMTGMMSNDEKENKEVIYIIESNLKLERTFA